MESTHELIYSSIDHTKTAHDQQVKENSGEISLIGEFFPKDLELDEMPIMALQAKRWASFIDRKLQACYGIIEEGGELEEGLKETLIRERGMTFEEYKSLINKGSSNIFISPDRPLSKQNYLDENPIHIEESWFYGDHKAYREAKKKREGREYAEYRKSFSNDEIISYSVRRLHAFQFLEIFIREINSYDCRENLKEFLDYNTPDMNGYMAFLEKIAILAPKPFKKLYEKRYCYIPTKSLQLHSYLTGSTGSGKTELIKFIIHNIQKTRAKAQYPRSIVVIEPDWKFCHELARHKDFDRENTLLFDVELDSRTIEQGRKIPSYNPFDYPYKDIASIDRYAQSLTNALEGSIGKEFTAHMKTIVKACFLVLLRWEGATFRDLFNILSEDKCQPYVEFALKNLDPDDSEIFEHDFTTDSFNYTKSSLRTKFRSILNPVLRRIMSAEKSSFDIDKILNEGGIGLFAMRGLGKEAGSMLGSLLMARIQHICFHRKGIPSQKPETFLFVDECHNYINDSIDDTLSEGRKHKIYLSLASQFSGKNMTPEMQKTVVTNTNLRMCGKVPDELQAVTAKRLGVSQKEISELQTGEFFMTDLNAPHIGKALKIYVPNWYVDTKGQIKSEQWGAFKIQQLNTFYASLNPPETKTLGRRRPESSKDRSERIQGDLSENNTERWEFE